MSCIFCKSRKEGRDVIICGSCLPVLYDKREREMLRRKVEDTGNKETIAYVRKLF